MATGAKKKKAAKSRAKRGTVGKTIFQQVEKMVAAKGLKRTAAFRALAKKTGRNEGTVAANYYRVAKLQGAKKTRRRGARRAKPIAGSRPAAARKVKRAARKTRGTVGARTFAQVEKMVAKEEISRAKAFKKLAAKTGRNAGTVAANYYRVARLKRGGKSAGGRPRGGAGKQAGSAVLRRAVAALRELTSLVERQQAELTRLRRENARFEAVRKLVGHV